MGGFGLERRLFAWRHFLDIAQIARKIKTKNERGLREISKQVETTSSKQDFVPKQFLKGLQILKF
jgi:hypothetical protein